MHAPSDPGASVTGKRRASLALVAALAATLTGCSNSSSDRAALDTPSTPATTAVASAGGAAVTFTGDRPNVDGHPAATEALTRFAAGLPPGCRPDTKRSDAHLVSLTWRCGDRISSATVTLDGRLLGLGDVLKGSYQQYLSSVAAAQFQVDGDASAATTDLTTWWLTPAALAVAFPAGVVSYPLASLQPYLEDPSAL